MVAASGIDSIEEGYEAAHEAVEERRLGEREAEPLDRGDLIAHLGLARDGLDHLAEQHADAGAGSGGAAAGPHAEGDRAAGRLADQFVGGGRLDERIEDLRWIEHFRSSLSGQWRETAPPR
jgi:hypothetical protein